MFANDIGIDLGTTTTLIYIAGKGIVLREPSIVAMDERNGQVLAVGDEAYTMLGKTASDIRVVRPLEDGVISDYEVTEQMLKHFFAKVNPSRVFKPRVCVCVPSAITEVESRSVIDTVMSSGARNVYLIEEPVAAAIGAGMDITRPGGIVVLPKEYDICQFTAIQHPADDVEGTTITTHYDFNSMHDILVKLDCLGHDDPTMMHRLEELTGVNFREIPLDDRKVMSLFSSPEALGVTQEQIMWETGTLGIPEFGTSFVRGMLMETRPTTMEELIRISGLSHGTDVWLGNAQDIINSGTAKLAQCFCTRDDIMNFLISKGMQEKMSFDIMESVRKGRGLKPEWEEAMREHDVPQWAIDSCHKIKYMFPRGHAVAYVTMGLRVAWYKVYRPQAYYAAYFTIRGDGFDAGRMLLSPETLRDRLTDFQNREEKMSVREKQEENAYHMLLEMQMRGIHMLPVDLYKSDPKRFLIEDGNLRCPFTAINGFGESAVEGIIASRDPNRPYISIEDLQNRAHIGQSIVEMLRGQGALEGLPETSQVDLFSLLG